MFSVPVVVLLLDALDVFFFFAAGEGDETVVGELVAHTQERAN